MGFFETLKRLAQGKPPFEVPVDAKTGQMQQPEASQPAPVRTGPKVVPHVEIERTTSRLNGNRLLVTCIIQNNAQDTIMLDKMRMIGTSRELDTYLRPGEERQFNVYDGTAPTNTNYSTAELYFRDSTGDYFSADHLIEYEREHDGNYTITEFKPLRTRDI